MGVLIAVIAFILALVVGWWLLSVALSVAGFLVKLFLVVVLALIIAGVVGAMFRTRRSRT